MFIKWKKCLSNDVLCLSNYKLSIWFSKNCLSNGKNVYQMTFHVSQIANCQYDFPNNVYQLGKMFIKSINMFIKLVNMFIKCVNMFPKSEPGFGGINRLSGLFKKYLHYILRNLVNL